MLFRSVAFYVTIIKQFDQVLSVPQGDNYYLGTAVGTTIRELASLIEQLKGESCNILWGGIPYRPLDVMNAVAPTELNSKSICWSSSIALAQGVKRLLETK